jgi:phytol kinase
MIFAVIAAVFIVLVGSEWWYRRSSLHGEFSRKFVHITIGSFVAFWPYILSYTEIKLLSIAFIVVLGISKLLNIFSAIHSVQRPTWGEFWFALVVGIMATFMTHHPHIFTVALLEMSLADGLAAVIGTKYGNSMRYNVFGSPKSVIGTATFFVVSTAILVVYSMQLSVLSPAIILSISLGATLLENIAVKGLDNLVIPLFVAAALLFYQIS